MDLVNLLGIVGAVIILIGFVLNEVHRLKADDIVYDSINFVGAVILIIYAFLIGSIPFVVLNVVWSLFALRDIVNFILKKS